jgi:hypothetical protein
MGFMVSDSEDVVRCSAKMRGAVEIHIREGLALLGDMRRVVVLHRHLTNKNRVDSEGGTGRRVIGVLYGTS